MNIFWLAVLAAWRAGGGCTQQWVRDMAKPLLYPKHTVKMAVEAMQLATTAVALLCADSGVRTAQALRTQQGMHPELSAAEERMVRRACTPVRWLGYKLGRPTHANHPCAVWAREHIDNARFLVRLSQAIDRMRQELGAESRRRGTTRSRSVGTPGLLSWKTVTLLQLLDGGSAVRAWRNADGLRLGEPAGDASVPEWWDRVALNKGARAGLHRPLSHPGLRPELGVTLPLPVAIDHRLDMPEQWVRTVVALKRYNRPLRPKAKRDQPAYEQALADWTKRVSALRKAPAEQLTQHVHDVEQCYRRYYAYKRDTVGGTPEWWEAPAWLDALPRAPAPPRPATAKGVPAKKAHKRKRPDSAE